jgi:hypothetical protein
MKSPLRRIMREAAILFAAMAIVIAGLATSVVQARHAGALVSTAGLAFCLPGQSSPDLPQLPNGAACDHCTLCKVGGGALPAGTVGGDLPFAAIPGSDTRPVFTLRWSTDPTARGPPPA